MSVIKLSIVSYKWVCDFINKIFVNCWHFLFMLSHPHTGKYQNVCVQLVWPRLCLWSHRIRMLFVFPYCASGFLGWQVNWFWTYFLYSLQGSGIWDTLPHCFVSLFTNQWISWMCVAFVYFVALDLFFVLFDTLSLGQFVLSLCSHIFLTRPAASSGTFTHTEKKFHSHSINANLNIFSNHCKRNK